MSKLSNSSQKVNKGDGLVYVPQSPPHYYNIPDRPPGDPDKFTEEQILQELGKCADPKRGIYYWTKNYCHIYDNKTRLWIPFELWPAQIDALRIMHENQYAIVLKARQVGLTWDALALESWNGLFFPEVLGLNFSRREDEAIELVHYRLKGIYKHLPYWMQVKEIQANTKREFHLSNGTRYKASSTGGSDSYAATFALVDEAELVHESGRSLRDFLAALEPTVGSAGGKMILISRSKKSRPHSTFKRIFNGAVAGSGNYVPIFIPWYARPDRTKAWYDLQCETALQVDGTLDAVYEQYPATPEEALAAQSFNKRYPGKWITQCFFPTAKLDVDYLENFPAIPSTLVTVYREVRQGCQYVISADTAEGNPHSDDSCAIVWDTERNEEVAILRGKLEMHSFARYICQLARYYNLARVFPERNSHGTAVIEYILNNPEADGVSLLEGPDSTKNVKKYGWRTTGFSKPRMTDYTADCLRDEVLTLHSSIVAQQLADIDGSTLSASEGNHDDAAMTVQLYCAALSRLNKSVQFALI